MSSNDFALRLHGFFELTDATELTPTQVAMIKEHLALVFNKVTIPLEKPKELTPSTLVDLLKGIDEQEHKEKAEESEDRKRRDRMWKDVVKELEKSKNVWPGLGDLTRPYCEPKSPYNGVTPIADWTVRFPTNITYCVTDTTIC